MRILITGAGGKLAHDCQLVMGDQYEMILCSRQDLDVTKPDQVQRVLKKGFPDIILNCAAYNRVDSCEVERETAHQVNGLGPKYLATGAASIGSRMIHISTNYVFDGEKALPQGYTEEEDPHPISYYGVTKLEGENAVREASDGNLIIRTAWLYGAQGSDFLKTIIKKAREGKAIRVIQDEFGSFTWTYRLAEQIKALITRGARGLYHATAEGFCSRYEMTKFLFEKLGIEVDVQPCLSKEFKTQAPRPKNAVLENKRLNTDRINLMRPWSEDLGEFIGKHGKQLIAMD